MAARPLFKWTFSKVCSFTACAAFQIYQNMEQVAQEAVAVRRHQNCLVVKILSDGAVPVVIRHDWCIWCRDALFHNSEVKCSSVDRCAHLGRWGGSFELSLFLHLYWLFSQLWASEMEMTINFRSSWVLTGFFGLYQETRGSSSGYRCSNTRLTLCLLTWSLMSLWYLSVRNHDHCIRARDQCYIYMC